MNLPQRIILSLILSVVFFAAFSLLAFTGLFDLVETRFYTPQLVKSLNGEVDRLSQTITALLEDLEDRFAETLENGAVKRSFLPNQAAEDILERSRLYGLLMSSLPGLRTVRFVDAGGSRIHFSTLDADVLAQNGSSLSYRSYRDGSGVLPYDEVATAEGRPPRLIFDSSGEQLIFSYPFSDSLDVYRGSALFTFSAQSLAERLTRQGQVKVGEDLALVDSPRGFLLDAPAAGRENLKREAAAAWREGILTLFNLDQEGTEPLTLISAKSGMGFFVGRLAQENILVLPSILRLILLGSFFLTAFLLVFLIFSLRQDSVAVIRSRLKQLQLSLIRQYYDSKSDIDWKFWSRELERRREDVRLEIKRGLPRRGKKNRDIDALIDRSWDEVVRVVGGPPSRELDEERIRALVGKMLQEAALADSTSTAYKPEPREEVEELGAEEEDTEPAELEPLEELEAVELSAEPEELLELADTEEAEVAEEIRGRDGSSPGGIVVTPDAFESGDNGEAELEPLEEAPPLTPEELAALASRIEFGSDTDGAANGLADGAAHGAANGLELSSPFQSLSFESPDFESSGFNGNEPDLPGPDGESGEADKKKRQTETGGNAAGGLEEISEQGGLPLIYRPFLFQGNGKPVLLRPLAEPGEGPIQEQDGIHHISSDILDPSLETAQNLDPKFLRLVESIIGREPLHK
jgi:hypothetical protein